MWQNNGNIPLTQFLRTYGFSRSTWSEMVKGGRAPETYTVAHGRRHRVFTTPQALKLLEERLDDSQRITGHAWMRSPLSRRQMAERMAVLVDCARRLSAQRRSQRLSPAELGTGGAP